MGSPVDISHAHPASISSSLLQRVIRSHSDFMKVYKSLCDGSRMNDFDTLLDSLFDQLPSCEDKPLTFCPHFRNFRVYRVYVGNV